jgi:hypothetical protein
MGLLGFEVTQKFCTRVVFLGIEVQSIPRIRHRPSLDGPADRGVIEVLSLHDSDGNGFEL